MENKSLLDAKMKENGERLKMKMNSERENGKAYAFKEVLISKQLIRQF